jgi:hypothetical protein
MIYKQETEETRIVTVASALKLSLNLEQINRGTFPNADLGRNNRFYRTQMAEEIASSFRPLPSLSSFSVTIT